EMDLTEQDAIVKTLTTEFPQARVVDRRVDPMFGYRAVHVVVRVGRCTCEVQVRTSQQHLWAEIVERLADRWGRQVRYGGSPDDPMHDIGTTTRQEFWEVLLGLSDAVHAIEEYAANQNFGVDNGVAPEGVDRVKVEEARSELRRVLAELVEFLDRGAAV
ncbi:MAG: hypothetical protein ACREMY_33970, partial [bacterium]